MPSKQTLGSLALLAALAGCSALDTPPPAAPAAHDCSAEAVPGLLGKPASAERVEQARQQSGAKRVRVLAPADAVTLDYNPQRLNIDIDEAGLIRRLSCG